MLQTSVPSEGLIFFGFLYRSDLFSEATFVERIEKLYGKVFTYSPEFNPLATYYSKEMGEETLLKRVFIITTESFPREFLLSNKLLSLNWEREWSLSEKRMVNVDVGFISAENFLLATTKNYSHRVFLGQNIFADLTYQCVEGKFQTLPWTYPDFKDQPKLDFFNWCRSFLLMRGKIETT